MTGTLKTLAAAALLAGAASVAAAAPVTVGQVFFAVDDVEANEGMRG